MLNKYAVIANLPQAIPCTVQKKHVGAHANGFVCGQDILSKDGLHKAHMLVSMCPMLKEELN